MIYGARGEFFFHYTTADTAFRHILPSGTLRLGPYTTMRDPLEAKAWHLAGAGFVEPGSNIDAEFVASYELAQRAKQRSKLLSLSVDAPYAEDDAPFGRGYALASMWELYGDAHAGVCLVFDRETLTRSFDIGLAPIGRAFHQPVRYTRAGVTSEPGATTLMLGGEEVPRRRSARTSRRIARPSSSQSSQTGNTSPNIGSSCSPIRPRRCRAATATRYGRS